MRQRHVLTTLAALTGGRSRAATGASGDDAACGLAVTDSATLIPLAQTFGYLERVGLAAAWQMLSNRAATVAALLGGTNAGPIENTNALCVRL
jgi:hypothetical protein